MKTGLHRIVPAVLAVVVLAATSLRAQESHPEAREERIKAPFVVGERLEYDVRFGKLHVGSGSMEIAPMEEVRGREVWHTVFQVQGGTFFYRVNDLYESWFDVRTGNSLRYRQKVSEGRRDVERLYEIFPERGAFMENGDTAKASVKEPLDEGSFLYFVRTIPLVVGETYTFDRYFRPDRNPVTIKVSRRDTIDVPAGRFPAIVIQPIIKANGIFSENGHAEIWLSDDSRHIMLQMKAGLSFGSINLYLQSYRPAQAATTPKTP